MSIFTEAPKSVASVQTSPRAAGSSAVANNNNLTRAAKPVETSPKSASRSEQESVQEKDFKSALAKAHGQKARKFQAQDADAASPKSAASEAVDRAQKGDAKPGEPSATPDDSAEVSADEAQAKKNEKPEENSKEVDPPALSDAAAVLIAQDSNAPTPDAPADFKPTDSGATGGSAAPVNALGAAATSAAPAEGATPDAGAARANSTSAAQANISAVDPDAPDDQAVAEAAPVQNPEKAESDLFKLPNDANPTLSNAPAQTVVKPQGNDVAAVVQPPLAPEAQFAEDNVPKVIHGITGQLLPNGGTMQLRLDPPEMGALTVSIRIDNGTVEASFQTSTDQATQLLGHSLTQLKTALENAGIVVDKLNVTQVPADKNTGSNDTQNQQNSQQAQEDARQFQQEQQRKEMIKRMWRKLSGSDDLDMVA